MHKSTLLLPAFLILSACGGGGSGGSSPPPFAPAPPPVTQTSAFSIPLTVVMTADAGVGANPITTVNATANVPLTDTQRGAFTMSSNGLDHVYFSPRADLTWETIFYFKDPREIGPGVYTDTVRVGLCTDTSCTALLPGTISTATITYTVTGTVPLPPAVRVAINSVTATSMAYTDERPRITVPLAYLYQRANRSFSATTSSACVGALQMLAVGIAAIGQDFQSMNPERFLRLCIHRQKLVSITLCGSHFVMHDQTALGLDRALHVVAEHRALAARAHQARFGFGRTVFVQPARLHAALENLQPLLSPPESLERLLNLLAIELCL